MYDFGLVDGKIAVTVFISGEDILSISRANVGSVSIYANTMFLLFVLFISV